MRSEEGRKERVDRVKEAKQFIANLKNNTSQFHLIITRSIDDCYEQP